MLGVVQMRTLDLAGDYCTLKRPLCAAVREGRTSEWRIYRGEEQKQKLTDAVSEPQTASCAVYTSSAMRGINKGG